MRLMYRAPRLLPGLLALLLLLPTGAAAQTEEKKGPFREPGINFRAVDSFKPYIDWAFGVLLIVAVALPAFKNPHRSHLD